MDKIQSRHRYVIVLPTSALLSNIAEELFTNDPWWRHDKQTLHETPAMYALPGIRLSALDYKRLLLQTPVDSLSKHKNSRFNAHATSLQR